MDVREITMTRLLATAITIGLIVFCTAAQSDPLVIQPTQEFAFVESTTDAVVVGESQLLSAPFVWRCRN